MTLLLSIPITCLLVNRAPCLEISLPRTTSSETYQNWYYFHKENENMKKSLKSLVCASLLAFTSQVSAESDSLGQFTTPSANDFNSSIKLAAALDYGLSVNVQFGKSFEFIVGTDGMGVDVAFWHYDLLPQSKFFSKRPLTFYVAGGAGYAWDDTNDIKEGFVVRVPAGADWKFAPKWSVYASFAPAINFVKEQGNRDSDVELQLMSNLGIRYHF